ncbi:MFS transporter [Pelagibacterium lentulum]|uniref:MFS transporter n=1 Tax=Pelagibacterium lentulum TaxID=2029865 RepID=A0A916RBF4_9HYPH|nr:MFS transporter [Pelagibacterium lentulum]GGA47433.1 MFS transporter [Pelagibacterium lentulum]
MALIMPARLASPEARTGLYYLTMFMPAGVASLLLPVWLDSKGISEEQIGIINAAPIFAMIVLNLVVGRIADKAKDWRSVIVAGSILAAVVPLGLGFVDEFWGILLFWTLATIPFLALEPVIDAAAMRMTRRRGSDFALVRVWGTVGYIIATALAGLIFGWVGIAIFVPLFIVASLMRGGASLSLPFFRAPDNSPDRSPVLDADAATTMRQVFRPWFLLPLIGTALLQASHFVLMAFGALLWLRIGIPEEAIGLLWGIAPLGEVIVMLFFARIARRFSARHLLLAACLLAVVRWSGVAVASEVWQLAILQVMHMFTFGLAYLGVVNFIANWTGESIAAQAQSFFTVLRQVSNVIALLVFGPLVAIFGIKSFYAAAALAAVGAAMIFASLIIMRTKR